MPVETILRSILRDRPLQNAKALFYAFRKAKLLHEDYMMDYGTCASASVARWLTCCPPAPALTVSPAIGCVYRLAWLPSQQGDLVAAVSLQRVAGDLRELDPGLRRFR